MSYEYNAETKNILQDWINTLKQNNAIDELFVSRLEDLINLTEIGDSEKIRELIESLEESSMTIKVTRLTAKNIRGIRQLELSLETNILALGENGCGKSSIVDTIEYYFTGRVEKLSGRQDIRENLSLQFAGGGPLNVAFRFSNNDNDYQVSFPYLKPEIPDKLQDFFKSAAERPFILRRSQLLHFIDSRPSERYDLVSNLIGLGDLDNIEAGWREKATDIARNLKSAKQQLSSIGIQLTTLLGTKIQTEQELILAVNRKLAEHDIESVTQYSDLINRKTVAHNKSANPENIRKAEQIRQIKRKADELVTQLGEIITIYSQLFSAWQIFLSNAETADEAMFEKLLTEGLQIVSQNLIENCPICEEPIANQHDLIHRLEERTNSLRAFTESRKAMEQQENIFLQTSSEFSRLTKELVADLSRLEFGEKSNLLEAHLTSKIKSLDTKFNPKTAKPAFPLEFQKEIVVQEIKTILMDISDIFTNQIDLLTPSEQESRILKLVDLLGQVDALWQSWSKASNRKEITEKIDAQLDAIHKELVAAKKRGLDQILGELDNIFNKLYDQIHPDEGYKKISLVLPRNRDSSIGLEAQKEGSESMHPLGIFSEGHLDSLGLCIFLAFIKRFNGAFNLIVLDDILTSIDAGHRMRVAKLIAREFKDYQIILTTHDEFWANELSTIFSNNGLVLKMIRMNPWNNDDGATYNDYIATDWEYYFDEIAKGRKQDAIAGTGRTLERFLYTMRKNLHIAVSATYDDRYTIGDLYEPFFTWSNKHPISRPDMPDFLLSFSVLKDELDDYWRFRNWAGAHYNEWGAAISQSEAQTFVKLVKELVSYLQCPACQTLVVYDSSNQVIHCSNCKPNPVAKIVWVYTSGWKQRVVRLRDNNNIKDKDINLTKLTIAAMENYLKDARRKLGLQIPATANDEYGLREIYGAFVEFVKVQPRFDESIWQEKITMATETLAEFMTPEYQWIEAKDIQTKNEILMEAVVHLTDLLECATCGHIVHFDHKKQIYFCAVCDEKEVFEAPGAHWYIE